MKLAIVGSRTFEDYGKMCSFIEENYDVSEITHIVSGGARGADRLGERFAKEHGIQLITHPAEWDTPSLTQNEILNSAGAAPVSVKPTEAAPETKLFPPRIPAP